MKKINNKGMTLAELIVSFALVAVAVIYFSQTIIVIRKMYVTAKKDTKNFVDVNYAFRLIDEAVKENNKDTKVDICGNTTNTTDTTVVIANIVNMDIDKKNKYICDDNAVSAPTKYRIITFSINNKSYTYYHYNQ